MSVAVVFPGQGAQFVGMGKDFYDKFSNIRDFYSNADRALGYSLSDIMFNGPENDLKLTQNTQPALVTMSASIWSLIKDKVQPAFFLTVNGNAGEGEERFGEQLGAILEEEIPAFLKELGEEIAGKGLTYDEWYEGHEERFREIAAGYFE